MASTQIQKQYDVVLFGATGFTGKLVASYLDTHAGKPTWAMAGRSTEKLQALVSSLKLTSKPGIIQADVAHPETLHAMARQAKSVVNVVGPFKRLHADLVIEACIAEKTHYTDLSGETNFNAEVNARFHEKAKAAGVVIGCSVGLDSLPSDLTAYLAVQHLKQKQGCPGADHVSMCLGQVGHFSSGTLNSAIDMANANPDLMRFVDAGALATRKPKNEMQFESAVWVPQFESYGAVYPLTPHNARTVYRSWSLLQDAGSENAYGENFDYHDLLRSGSWAFSKLAGLVVLVQNFFLLNVPPVRTVLKTLAKPGAGPSEDVLHNTIFDARTLATYGDKRALCTIKAKGDPGYFLSARMISETALACALEHDKLHPLGKQGGALTSATIGAEIIAERLEKYGQFEIRTRAFS